VAIKPLRLKTFGGLWVESSDAGTQRGTRPRPLALLAILAAAEPKGTSRDRALSILWSEADGERARHALSQTLYSLRRDLGADVVISAPELRLQASLITSDIDDFRKAVANKRWADAAALYAGPFLDGFYLADAPEFERWAEVERQALGADGIRAIEFVAKDAMQHARHDEAQAAWGRLTRLDPFNGRFAAYYMEALAAHGARNAALAHGKSYVELVKRELDAEPDRAVQKVLARLREAERLSGPMPVQDAPVAPPAPWSSVSGDVPRLTRAEIAPGGAVSSLSPTSLEPSSRATPDDAGSAAAPRALVTAPTAAPPRRTSSISLRIPRRTVRIGAATAITVVLAALGFRFAVASRAPEHPVVAVGRIRDLVTTDSATLGGVLSEMLSTSLARVADLQVIANSRMLELTPRAADTSRTAVTDAARRAGATEIVEGELIPLPDKLLRLEVRRVDIDRGLVRAGYRVTGADRIALFDSVTSLIAADLRLGAPTGSLAEVSTRSPIALRFYEEGLRAFYQFDADAANRLFRAAIKEDSTFAMATYYAWRASLMIGDTAQYTLAARAVALSSRASPRDRLLIISHVGHARNDLSARAPAETLAAKYPRDPEALIRAAAVIPVLSQTFDLLNRAIAIDSAAGVAPSGVCRLCEALLMLGTNYVWADSMADAERTSRRWIRMRPQDKAPWLTLYDVLLSVGRVQEADEALRKYVSLGGPRGGPVEAITEAIRSDDAEGANSQCNVALRATNTAEFDEARWYCGIALRGQGRYKEALLLAREGKIPQSTIVHRGLPPEPFASAILDMEMGRALIAADEFRAMDRPLLASQTSVSAQNVPRNLTWYLTLSATAAVAGGDTIRARNLVDSIEVIGRQSLFPRDPKLHHFVRGLLLARANQQEEAVREFRAAIHSPTNGYTRINYELGKSLLALNRPAEAVSIVRAPLHGGLEGSGLYLTRTETHELLAQVFDRLGARDSAAAHYAVVERLWRNADSSMKPRYEAARQWLVRAGRLK
jgi:DNA-binding SARP family transcriptional activator/TolB-like protein